MIDDKEAERRLRWMLFDSGIIGLCLLGMWMSQLLSPYVGFTVFFLSLVGCTVLMVITIIEIIQLTYSVDKFMIHEIALPKHIVEAYDSTRKKLVEEARRLQEDKSGILWIWAVCLLTIVIMSIAWFTLSWPAFMILDAILASYTFPPTARLAITLVSNVISWFLILMTIGLLFWAFVNSGRRETETYRI